VYTSTCTCRCCLTASRAAEKDYSRDQDVWGQIQRDICFTVVPADSAIRYKW